MTEGLDKLSTADIKTHYINLATAQIVQAYLEYSGNIIEATQNKQSIGSDKFREIDDDLVIKPYELVDLIDEIQKALRESDD